VKKIIIILLVLVSQITQAQKYKFGKVSKAELEEKFYPLDSTADAAVLYSERKTSFEFVSGQGFHIVEKYFKRIKIYTPEGYNQATKEILTYHDSESQKVTGIKAKTYTLEGGKIVKTKLKSKNIYKTKKNKYYDITSFTMPNLKSGCILEWKYTFTSPYIGMLNPVEIQEEIPVKKILARIATPEYFNYNTKTKGFIHIPIKSDIVKRHATNTEKTRSKSIWKPTKTSYNTSTISYDEKIQIIEMSDISALKDEPLSGNINNYKSGIDYELSFVKYPNSPIKAYATSWESVVEKIYQNTYFGEQIKKTKHFRDELNSTLQGVTDINGRINTIFQFAKNKIKWNDYYGKYSDEGVKKAYKKGEGSVGDINLSLVAMLQYAGLDANPVLVSTIENGIPIFPTRYGFNYVIAAVQSPDGLVLLDATEKNSLPNVLPRRVLNFQGMLIKKNGKSEWIPLYPTQHSFSKTVISAKLNEMGFSGVARKTLTNNLLLNYRIEVRDKSKDDLIKWIDEDYKEIEVINARVSNLDNLEKNTIETIQFESESFVEEIDGKIYINPLLYKQLTQNKFKTDKRNFSIFYDYPRAYINEVNISLPENYSVESIPEALEFILPDNLGFFKYTILQEGAMLKVKSSLVINKAVIPANYYTDLKEFYNQIIVKEAEKIIIQKK